MGPQGGAAGGHAPAPVQPFESEGIKKVNLFFGDPLDD
jgi:hypothetical protein